MNGYLSFGYWVRRRRKALDITQSELARLVFCSLSTIKKIELDERRPSRQIADRLAECLQVPGSERKSFLAVANAELSVDRLNSPDNLTISRPPTSNLHFYQPATPFVGFKDELTHISDLLNLPGSRLITLVGPGGIGKSRLALQVASKQLERFPDGVFFVPLAQLSNPAYIVPAILEALSLQMPVAEDPRAYLLDYLHAKTMLFVLDNFEQLLAGVDLLVELTRTAPAIVLLVTSRVPLNLRLEQVFELKGMKIPLDRVAGDFKSYDAVQLFIQTAKRASSGFEPGDDDLSSIFNIIKLVEGMPLAIELAASWSRTRSCAEIESEIKNGLDILTSKMVDIPERHRSMRVAFEFSWESLSEEEKCVFAALSVFRGGFQRQAAEHIAHADGPTLASLVNKSLLRRAASNRYDMHELLYRYSREKLAVEEINRLQDIHLSYYMNLAENAMEKSKFTPDEVRLSNVEKELDNFRTALEWAAQNRLHERGFRLAIALGTFWRENGYLREGMSWLGKLLESDNHQFPAYRAAALIRCAEFAQTLGIFEQAIRLNKESLFICTALKDKHGIGLSLLNVGIVRYLNGNSIRGARLLRKSISIFQEIDDEKDQSLALLRLADLNMRQGLLDEASNLYQRALIISTRLNITHAIAFSLGGLGDIKRLQGHYLEAIDLFKRSLQIHWIENHRLDIPYLLEALGLDYAAIGNQVLAANLWGAAESVREQTHSPVPPSYQASYAPIIAATRISLGETNFSQAWDEGKSISLDRIIIDFLHISG